MQLKVLAILLLLATPAVAQQPQPQPSPLEQALGQKLGEEVNANIGLRAQIIQLQNQLRELREPQKKDDDQEKKIEELRAKAHPLPIDKPAIPDAPSPAER